jgi:uncharacterized membrane protein
MRRYLLIATIFLFALPGFGQYAFTTVDYPGAAITRLIGLNDHLDMVGTYVMPGGLRHAMLYSHGTFVALDADGVLGRFTSGATQINNRGDISGWYSDVPGRRHGFVLRKGVLTTVDYPGASFTQVNGISDAGAIFGHFIDAAGLVHGFLLKDGVFEQLDYPGAVDTIPFYINASGTIAGEWDTDPATIGHGFVRTQNGAWISIDAPGAPPESTLAIGVNDHGQVLGFYLQNDGRLRTFIVDAGDLAPAGFTFIDLPPGGSPETLNNAGVFVGFYRDANGTHGFIASPKPAK